MTPIYLRNLPPPDETFDHAKFLADFARWLKPEHYLELGVRDGHTFKEVTKYCKRATGVDTAKCEFILEPCAETKRCTTDEYFASLTTEQFDMVFVDADHSHQQSLKDFLAVVPRVIEDGFIFLHDTYPCQPRLFAPDKCSDCWLTPLFIKRNFIENFEVVTLPFNVGLTIVKKIDRTKQLAYVTYA